MKKQNSDTEALKALRDCGLTQNESIAVLHAIKQKNDSTMPELVIKAGKPSGGN